MDILSQNPGLILGTHGQIARALGRLLPHAIRWGREQADFLTPETWLPGLARVRPAWVINACAYTAVDRAELPEEADRARLVNAETPRLLAETCARLGIPLIHYSTDYVYPGAMPSPRLWLESDPTGPLNGYGRTKLAGDTGIEKAGGHHLIFRTSWVFDEAGQNFVNTMLRLGRDRPELRVVADQWGAPSYASDLARMTVMALETALQSTDFPSGVYHLCNAGETNWSGFARTIFEEARLAGLLPADCQPRVLDIPSSDYPTPARRPLNSRLSLEKLRTTFNVTPPDWRDALRRCLRNKMESNE